MGHAIEAHENGKLLHGEAVAIGTILELNLTNQDIKSKVSNLYKKFEISYELPQNVKLENLFQFLTKDKKNKDSLIGI